MSAEEGTRWWITAPIGHRQHAADTRPSTVSILGKDVPVISAGEPPLDEWVCDFCSDPILLERTAGETTVPWMVPMFDSNALCTPCACRILGREAAPFRIRDWSQSGCGCPPCKNVMPILLPLYHVIGWT